MPTRELGGGCANASGQIGRTLAESQRIVAARPLCRLQYPVLAKSSAKDLPQGRLILSCLGLSRLVAFSREPTSMLLHWDKPNVFLDGGHPRESDPAPSTASDLEAFCL